jgi:Na+/melibiose symporter-like transporter
MTTENTQRKKYESISHGLGITGLIVGIITLLVSFIPCFGVFAFIFGIIAILISVIGLAIALKHDHPKGLIIGALVTAFLGCAIAYTQYSAMKGTVDTINNIEKNRIENQKKAE